MVHLFAQGGYHMALDTPSGALHVLTPVAYDILRTADTHLNEVCPDSIIRALCAYPENEIREAYDELFTLQSEGMLNSEDIRYEPIKNSVIKSICLNISHDCNMRCRYCFAGKGGYEHERSLMSYETGCRALDFLFERSGAVKHLEVDFFGGEPLMNFETVKKLVVYGRENEKTLGKHINFTMTTNGALLDDESIDFINENIFNAVLSIDGLKSTNDNMRLFEDGSGTYDTILPKFKKLVSRRNGGEYYVRGTYTRENLHFCDDVLHLADEGFDQISVEPVVLPESDPLSIREEDLPVIFGEYEKLAGEMIKRYKEGRPFNFFHFMIDLDAGPCVYKRIKGCGSGTEYVAITPNGDIYPCHQFVGDEKFIIGNVNKGDFDTSSRAGFASNNIVENPECSACWVKYFCGGGCAANNCKYSGCISKPYGISCKIEKKRVECAMAIKAALSELED